MAKLYPMITRRSLLIGSVLAAPASFAKRRPAHCPRTRQTIRDLTDRLRRPYRAKRGVAVKDRLRKLKKLYHRECR